MDLDRLIGIFGVVFFLAIALRVYLIYRENGFIPIVFGTSDSAHDFVHKIMMLIVVLEIINVVTFRLQALSAYLSLDYLATFYRYLSPIPALEIPAVKIAGIIIAYIALAWSAFSQSQMGKDWRVGIDDANDTSLVTDGVYKISRHPIYLGFIFITLGLFLAVPNAVSLICAVLAAVTLSVQARLEEEFLAAKHGKQYRDYLAQTRRWL